MAKQSKLTRKVKVFKAAVVRDGIANVTHHGPQGGATYTLKSGAVFNMSPSECRALSTASVTGRV